MTEQDRSDLKGIPLSISQERLWFLDQLHRGNAAQNLACGLCFTGLIDRAALNCAVDEVVQRYEILRTEFHSMDGSPLQVVLSPVRVTVRAVDLGHVAPDAQKAELLRLAQSEAQSPFDLTRGPLLRATIFQLSDTQHVFVLVIHRIVCDGASPQTRAERSRLAVSGTAERRVAGIGRHPDSIPRVRGAECGSFSSTDLLLEATVEGGSSNYRSSCRSPETVGTDLPRRQAEDVD